ncbi:MAG: hypothetical protein AB7O82_00610, partial [Reyranella sp.]
LNRVALGTQTVSVWKDARLLGRTAGEQAMAMAKGAKLAALQGTKSWADGPRKVPMTSILLTPVPITRDNLDVVIQANWVPKDVVCRGETPGTVKACNCAAGAHTQAAMQAGRLFRTAGVPPAHEKSGRDARGPEEPLMEASSTAVGELPDPVLT